MGHYDISVTGLHQNFTEALVDLFSLYTIEYEFKSELRGVLIDLNNLDLSGNTTELTLSIA